MVHFVHVKLFYWYMLILSVSSSEELYLIIPRHVTPFKDMYVHNKAEQLHYWKYILSVIFKFILLHVQCILLHNDETTRFNDDLTFDLHQNIRLLYLICDQYIRSLSLHTKESTTSSRRIKSHLVHGIVIEIYINFNTSHTVWYFRIELNWICLLSLHNYTWTWETSRVVHGIARLSDVHITL